MNSELESEEKADQKPNLRRRIMFSYWLLLFLAIIIPYRVYLVRWPTEGPSWNGLTVGQSTTEDVIATLGEPSKISVGLTTGTVYYYKATYSGRPTIYFRNNRIIRIQIFNEERVTLFNFVEQYGKPDYIVDEIGLSVVSKGVYWSDEGIYISSVLEGGSLVWIIYFRPCPRFDGFCIINEQLHYYGLAPPGEDPWGIMSP